MHTKFGSILTGRLFPKLFLILCIAMTGMAAYATAEAAQWLLGMDWIAWLIYPAYAISTFVILYPKQWDNLFFRKFLNLFRCFSVYYGLLVVPCVIFAGLPITSDWLSVLLIFLPIPAGIAIVLRGFWNTRKIETRRYCLTLGNSGKNYRIALLSDIHMGTYVRSKHIQKITQTIKSISPDLVVISGDLFDVGNDILENKAELRAISQMLRKIKAKDGVYAVLGNHDPSISDSRLRHFLKDAKVQLLDNRCVVLSKIMLVGRTDEGNNTRLSWENTVSIHSAKPIIVLDHKPQGIDEAAEHGASLVLSGHTHQGQFFPATIFTKLANGRDYFYGLNKVRDTYGITTSGAGFFELPIRLGTRNEIVDIHLKL